MMDFLEVIVSLIVACGYIFLSGLVSYGLNDKLFNDGLESDGVWILISIKAVEIIGVAYIVYAVWI